jgi:primase-polymerase (primpol)-like protein
MMKFDTIPDELKQLKQWVLWKIEIDDKGKPTKVPYKPNGKHPQQDLRTGRALIPPAHSAKTSMV